MEYSEAIVQKYAKRSTTATHTTDDNLIKVTEYPNYIGSNSPL